MNAIRSGGRWWTLAAMCFALFMIMLDNTIVNVALPSIQRDLGASQTSLEWMVDAYILAFAVLILLGGKLGDRFGRKRLFLTGLAIFTLMSAGCALAPGEEWLIAFRAAQGVGAAIMNPLSLSIIVAAFDRRTLGTAIGIWAGVSALGLAIGPVLGGLLTEHVGWSAVFWVNVPVGVVALAATWLVVRESRDPTTRALDLPGTGLATLGLFGVVFALVETTSHPWGSSLVLGFLVAGLALLTAFVAWEARTAEPMLPLRFFRRGAFSASVLVGAFVGLGLFGVVFFITLFMQNVMGWSPAEAGLRSLPLTGMFMVVGPLSGRLLRTIGPRTMMTVGMLFVTGGLAGLTRLHVGSGYDGIWPYYVLIGAGMALAMPATSTMAMSAVEREKSGVASGVLNAARQVGAALGVAILGSVGSTVAGNRWDDRIADLPAGLHARAEQLTPLVTGGQGAAVGRLAGPQAQEAALSAFAGGVTAAMWVGAGLTLLAALTAFLGMRGPGRAAASAEGAPVALEV